MNDSKHGYKYKPWTPTKKLTSSKYDYKKVRVIEAIGEPVDTQIIVNYGNYKGAFKLAGLWSQAHWEKKDGGEK